jgi:hypothetical protein
MDPQNAPEKPRFLNPRTALTMTPSFAVVPDTLVVGGGGQQLVAGGAVWTFGPIGGDRMAAVLRNGAEVAGERAALLHWRGGAMYAQDGTGGWRRFNGTNWVAAPDVGPDAKPALPAPDPAAPVCVVCGGPEQRVIHGNSYCSDHTDADLNPAPLAA